jgi:hypothetical protein
MAKVKLTVVRHFLFECPSWAFQAPFCFADVNLKDHAPHLLAIQASGSLDLHQQMDAFVSGVTFVF